MWQFEWSKYHCYKQALPWYDLICLKTIKPKQTNIDIYSQETWWLVGWLCFTSHRQRGNLETAPPFTVPCEGHGARLVHRTHLERTPGLRVAVHYTTAAPGQLQFLWHGIPIWQHEWFKYHCYKQAPSRYDLICLKTMLNPNKHSCLLKRHEISINHNKFYIRTTPGFQVKIHSPGASKPGYCFTKNRIKVYDLYTCMCLCVRGKIYKNNIWERS